MYGKLLTAGRWLHFPTFSSCVLRTPRDAFTFTHPRVHLALCGWPYSPKQVALYIGAKESLSGESVCAPRDSVKTSSALSSGATTVMCNPHSDEGLFFDSASFPTLFLWTTRATSGCYQSFPLFDAGYFKSSHVAIAVPFPRKWIPTTNALSDPDFSGGYSRKTLC